MDGQKDIALVIFSVEQRLELQRPVLGLKLKDTCVNLRRIFLVSVILLLIQLDEVIGLINVLEELLKR